MFDVQGSGAGVYADWIDWEHWIGSCYKPGRFYVNEYIDDGYVGSHYINGIYSDIDATAWHHLKYVKDPTTISMYFGPADRAGRCLIDRCRCPAA